MKNNITNNFVQNYGFKDKEATICNKCFDFPYGRKLLKMLQVLC